MSLQFCLGASGAGKSYRLHKDITAWAERERDRNFFFLVPDQFTMQTQIDLVKASSHGGIMNIDVLSFGRLAHRIFEETGAERYLVLDDTGKNLIVQRLVSELQDSLPILGRNLGKPGYIHEIKSVISEFKQYDISSEKLDELIGYSASRGMLRGKLRDLAVIYEAFNHYTRDRFVTTEETMTLLTQMLDRSELIKNSVVIFDGFTGFTPVQYRLIRRLLELTDRVIVSVTVDINENPYRIEGEQELFYLSKQTIWNLQRCAQESSRKQEEDVLLNEKYRFAKSPALAHLEHSVFRYPTAVYEDEVNEISITEAPDILSEVRSVCLSILDLVTDGGFSYRDIAVICGDLPSYADAFRRLGISYGIPVFIDETSRLRLDPFTEYLRSALLVRRENFSYASVFHFLRSGFADLNREEIDRLENYVLACGLRGEKKYRDAFTRLPGHRPGQEITEEMLRELQGLNNSRDVLVKSLSPLLVREKTVGGYVSALKEFIEQNALREKLSEYERMFTEEGKSEKAREYAQLYELVWALLTQIGELLPEEKTDIDDFIRLFDAGLDEIDVGTIPGGVDRVIVGDMERSRMKEVKVLFLTGVNDGNIPRANKGGGLISDAEREFLRASGIELSPTPREQIYTQRLYLYMNMTKPKERLFLSFSRMDSAGKALRESYLIPMLRRMFPALKVREAVVMADSFAATANLKDASSLLADALRTEGEDAKGLLSTEELSALFQVMRKTPEGRKRADELLTAATYEYSPQALSKELAAKLYGAVLKGSVSRIETFYACAYRHFLTYGMALSEREEFTLAPRDLGNIYHEVLERFSEGLSDHGYTLADFPDDTGEALLKSTLSEVCAGYGEVILYSSKEYEYMIERIRTVLWRTVRTFRAQLQGGEFATWAYEYSFAEELPLEENAKMRLRGRIDRIDLYKNNGRNYVKIIDFKSGHKELELDALLYGLQLQMPVYMNAALREMKKRYPGEEAKMAAMLYYQMKDPLIAENELPKEDAEPAQELLKELRPEGLLNNGEEAIQGLDRRLSEPSVRSELVPAATNKDGSLSANSSVIAEKDYEAIGACTEKLLTGAGNRILEGDIRIEPKQLRTFDSCTYCAYREICAFDDRLRGFEKKELPGLKKEEALERMRDGE